MSMQVPMTKITTSHSNEEMKQFMFALYVEEKASN